MMAGHAQAQEAVFSGTVKDYQGSAMIIDAATNQPVDSVQVAADGKFTAKLNISEPKTFYFVLQDPQLGFKLYLEPKDKLKGQVARYDTIVNGQKTTMWRSTFSGKNADCNTYANDLSKNFFMIQNEVLMQTASQKLNFLQFKQLFNAKIDSVKALADKQLKNKTYREATKKDYDAKLTPAYTWFGQMATQPDDDYKAYLTSVDLNNPANIATAMSYADYNKKFCLPKDGDPIIAYLKLLPTLFTNDVVIGMLADQEIQNVIQTAPTNLDDIYAAYKQVKGSAPVSAEIEQLYNHYKAMTVGKQAIDFDMYDTEGNKVMLSDLRGKAVYIDCWATWCGPCKMETPHMAKLYEHYKDNPNIVLVSISLDNTEKPWLAMLKQDNPQWPQYIVKNAFESALCKNYSINAIPRFLMFDKEGRVISLDAPRPSSSEIIDFIDKALQ